MQEAELELLGRLAHYVTALTDGRTAGRTKTNPTQMNHKQTMADRRGTHRRVISSELWKLGQPSKSLQTLPEESDMTSTNETLSLTWSLRTLCLSSGSFD